MGIISKMLNERPKFDLPFTVVEIVSLSDNRKTTFRIIDDCYSIKGKIVKTIELYSFEGEYGEMYMKCVDWCLKRAKYVNECRLAGLL